jgi:hypothetical protein
VTPKKRLRNIFYRFTDKEALRNTHYVVKTKPVPTKTNSIKEEHTMAQKISVVLFAVFCLLFAGASINLETASAAGAVSVPTASGNDVLLPKAFIDTVSQYGDNVVAVFHDVRGDGHEVPMTFDGVNWIAPGARGADFHPAVKTDKGYQWALIEAVWDTGSAFVKWRPNGPCLNVQ